MQAKHHIQQLAPSAGPDAPPSKGQFAGVFPLSLAQESVWLFEQVEPGTAAYSLPEAWKIAGTVDPQVLASVFSKLIERHETLRTIFRLEAESPRQCILQRSDFVLEHATIDHDHAPNGAVHSWLNERASLPFDLNNGPLIRASLLKVEETEHVLLLNLHHLISDAWSQNLLIEELAQLYSALVSNQPANLPELPVQYADVAVWERDMLSTEYHLASAEYWNRQLANAPPPIQLPENFDARQQPFAGNTRFFAFAPEFSSELTEFSRQQNVTVFMTLTAALMTWLRLYSSEEDILVGAPFSGRQRPETEGLIGMFAHALPLRTNLAGDPTFVEVLHRVRDTILDASSHQCLPIQAFKTSGADFLSSPALSPFKVVVSLQPASRDSLPFGSAKATRIELDSGAAKFDWALLFSHGADGLRLRFEYKRQRFCVNSVDRLVAQLQKLLVQAFKSPTLRISNLDLHLDADAELLTGELAGITQPESCKSSVSQIFESVADTCANSTAVCFGAETYTYAQLNQRSNQLARLLQSQGVCHSSRVGVCLDRSAGMIVAILAILKLGAAYVPIEASWPKERIRWTLFDSGAALVVTDKDIQSLELAGNVRPLLLQTALQMSNCYGQDPLQLAAGPGDLAYIMYTSGSTGTPKGVCIPHRGIVRLVSNTDYASFSPEQVFLQFAPISFDASTFEIWGALLNGARLEVFPSELQGLDQLGAFIQERGVTTVWLTAGLFNQFVDDHLHYLRGVSQLLTGGEALSVPHVKKALQQLPNVRLINGYGPTENTTFTCCYTVPPDWSGNLSVPIGSPINNTRVFVLDEDLRPVPLGFVGELYTAGFGVASGYLNRPELTAQHFIPNPFSTSPDDKFLYRTGDRVRWLEPGILDFKGRIDDQLKIRGFRVEPGEIRAALNSNPRILDSAVVAVETHSTGKTLAAYYVSDTAVTPNDLRDFLAVRLPAYMLPSHFIPLDHLPLNPNGKLDRKNLPVLDPATAPEKCSIPPRDELEESLLLIWSEVLERDSFGVTENFFHLGGHSLLAMRAVARMKAAFGVDLSLRDLFDRPTIEAIASHLAQSRGKRNAPSRIMPRSTSAQARELLASLDQLSEAELEEMLRDTQPATEPNRF